jgi:hypothetical protein
MQESRWEKLYEIIDNKFGIEKGTVKEVEIKEGVKGKKETIIFSTPKGKMRLERLIKPKVERVKSYYSRRTARGAHQEAQYSSTETVEVIKLYQWNQRTNIWKEIDFNKL